MIPEQRLLPLSRALRLHLIAIFCDVSSCILAHCLAYTCVLYIVWESKAFSKKNAVTSLGLSAKEACTATMLLPPCKCLLSRVLLCLYVLYRIWLHFIPAHS